MYGHSSVLQKNNSRFHEYMDLFNFCGKFAKIKGQLISKANCQAVNSSKKRLNELVFIIIRH